MRVWPPATQCGMEPFRQQLWVWMDPFYGVRPYVSLPRFGGQTETRFRELRATHKYALANDTSPPVPSVRHTKLAYRATALTVIPMMIMMPVVDTWVQSAVKICTQHAELVQGHSQYSTATHTTMASPIQRGDPLPRSTGQSGCSLPWASLECLRRFLSNAKRAAPRVPWIRKSWSNGMLHGTNANYHNIMTAVVPLTFEHELPVVSPVRLSWELSLRTWGKYPTPHYY